MANVYDLAVAARSIVDDNYGWEVWQMANRYLAQHEDSELETVRLSAGEIWINTKKLRIRRRLPATQAAPETRRTQTSQERKIHPANGRARPPATRSAPILPKIW